MRPNSACTRPAPGRGDIFSPVARAGEAQRYAYKLMQLQKYFLAATAVMALGCAPGRSTIRDSQATGSERPNNPQLDQVEISSARDLDRLDNFKVIVKEVRKRFPEKDWESDATFISTIQAALTSAGLAVLDRTAFEDQMAELRVQHSGAVNSTDIRGLGKASGAGILVYGSIDVEDLMDKEVEVVLKAISVESGEIVSTVRFSGNARGAVSLASIKLGLALNFAQELSEVRRTGRVPEGTLFPELYEDALREYRQAHTP